jgi:hypothetical protein
MLWNTDLVGDVLGMEEALANDYAYFAGDEFAYLGFPGSNPGSCWCFFNSPESGNYVVMVQVESFIHPDTPSVVECSIDGSSFGQLSFSSWINQPHHAMLGAGDHEFEIKQVSGAFFFLSLTAYHVWSQGVGSQVA